MIASLGDEVCQRVGNEVLCHSGRTGSLPELRLAAFSLGRKDTLPLGDIDSDGPAGPCAWSAGQLRSDTMHSGGAPGLSPFYGSWKESPYLADLDGDGRDDLWLGSRGLLRCDVGHDAGWSEIHLSFAQAGDQHLFGDSYGDGSDGPCVPWAGKLLCDTAYDGGASEAEILLGTPEAPVLIGNFDGRLSGRTSGACRITGRVGSLLSIDEHLIELYHHMEWAGAAMWSAVLASKPASVDPVTLRRYQHIHFVQRAFLSLWRGEGIDGRLGFWPGLWRVGPRAGTRRRVGRSGNANDDLSIALDLESLHLSLGFPTSA